MSWAGGGRAPDQLEKHCFQSSPAPWTSTRKFQKGSLQDTSRWNDWETRKAQSVWHDHDRESSLTQSESWVGEKLVNKTSQQPTSLTLPASKSKSQGGVERERGSRWASTWVASRQCSGLDRLATGLRVACDFSRWDSRRLLKIFASEMKRTLPPEQVWSENRKRMKWFICITSCEIRKMTTCI